MPDEQKGQDDPNLSDDFLPEDIDSDWGEAWESAFEAEEDELTTGPAEQDDFFIGEDEEQTAAAGPSPTPEATASPSETSFESLSESSSSGKVLAYAVSLLHLLRRIPGRLADLKKISAGLLQRYHALDSRKKIMLGGGTVLLLVIAAAGSFVLGPKEPLHETAAQSLIEQNKAYNIPAPDSKQMQVEVADTAQEAAGMLPEKVRKKWSIPAFFIPISSQDGDKSVSFLAIDLTLVTVLDEDEEVPTDKEAFVRDIIYQFYINRPLFELRRYSLARGDMNRELRAWLHKQWPEGPIETIIFNKYHLT